jgi:hydroxyacylglutathione hydrolase
MVQKKLSSKLLLTMIIVTVLIVPMASVSAKEFKKNDSINEYPISRNVIRFEEIIPLNIPPEYGYPIPSGAYYMVNIYGIDVGRGVILIDSGDEAQAHQLYQSVKKAFKEPIIAVYLTHGHADHAGGGSYFQSKGIPVYSSLYEAPMIEVGAANPYMDVPDAFTYTGYMPDYSYDVDGVADGFTVLPTPGHTLGSVSIEYASAFGTYLFTGDTILENPGADQNDYSYTLSLFTAVQLYYLAPSLIDMWQYSITYLETAVPSIGTVCPGHGVTYSGTEALGYLGVTAYTLTYIVPTIPLP